MSTSLTSSAGNGIQLHDAEPPTQAGQLEHVTSILTRVTPAEAIKERPGKGGGTWRFVDPSYVIRTLNEAFGYGWGFEIIDQQIHGEPGHEMVVVRGRLTVLAGRVPLVKEQYGRKEVAYRKGGTTVPLDIGNDFKSAGTGALKKCAELLGVGLDIDEDNDAARVDPVEAAREQALDVLVHLLQQLEIPQTSYGVIVMQLLGHPKEMPSNQLAPDEVETATANLQHIAEQLGAKAKGFLGWAMTKGLPVTSTTAIEEALEQARDSKKPKPAPKEIVVEAKDDPPPPPKRKTRKKKEPQEPTAGDLSQLLYAETPVKHKDEG